MAPPTKSTPAPKLPKPVKLSREGATLAGAIYALAVAETLKTQIPTDVKLAQLADASTAAAKAFEPVLEKAGGYDGGPEDEEERAPTGGESVTPLTNRA